MSNSSISVGSGAAATTAASGAISGQNASAAPAGATKEQIHQAAQKFESMLLRQMLAESRKTDLSDGMLSNEGTRTFREMQDARFADTVAERGTLGFAKLIEAQLARQTHLSTNTATTATSGEG